MNTVKFKVEFRSYNDITEGYPSIFDYLASSESAKKEGIFTRIDLRRDESKKQHCLDEDDIYFPKGLHIYNLDMPLDKESHEDNVATFEVEESNAWGMWKFLMALGTHGNGGHSYELCIGNKWLSVDGDGADWLKKINGADSHKWKKINSYNYKDYALEKNDEQTLNEQKLRNIIKQVIFEEIKRIN